MCIRDRHYISRKGSGEGNHFMKQEQLGCPVFALGQNHAILRRISTETDKKAWAFCHEFKMETVYYQSVTPNCMPPVDGWTHEDCLGCPPAPVLTYVRYPEAVAEYKEFGNQAFKEGDLPLALEQWTLALKVGQNGPHEALDAAVVGTLFSNKSEAEWQLALQLPDDQEAHRQGQSVEKEGRTHKFMESLDSANFALVAFKAADVNPGLAKKARYRLLRAQRQLGRWSDAADTIRAVPCLTQELDHQLLEVLSLEEASRTSCDWAAVMRFGMKTLRNSSTVLDVAAGVRRVRGQGVRCRRVPCSP
eukprot:TRINITY_DN18670_c0_g1_i1.p1 TRINITY_DN18670_c0_g1~~TRINITY_DN18670_c0_g1_i1.p1  ORF type:complete len:305 (-),score=72.67 TRINITY_DN18670_c0_g1_i1:763-1677(-)